MNWISLLLCIYPLLLVVLLYFSYIGKLFFKENLLLKGRRIPWLLQTGNTDICLAWVGQTVGTIQLADFIHWVPGLGNILTVQGRYIVISPSIMLRTSLLSKILSVTLFYYLFWGKIVRKPNKAGQNFIHIKKLNTT